jgi:acylphosphatase
MKKKILIYGRVQGVFFRKFVKDNALKLGLNGYVRNIDDGSVEAIFEGDEEQINKMVEICKKGSLGSRVDKVLINELKEDEEFEGFEVGY